MDVNTRERVPVVRKKTSKVQSKTVTSGFSTKMFNSLDTSNDSGVGLGWAEVWHMDSTDCNTITCHVRKLGCNT
jgi:hypothetical protein